MSFLNPVFLLALGLVLIPVVLHFLLKTKPKKLLFPALRLIQARRQQNSRRFRLRHLWLLLLRMLVIAGLVMALTRPTLPAANYGLSRSEWLTALAVLAVAAGAYCGLMALWKRRHVPRHDLLSRRTSLRGGLGLATFVLLLLLVGWPYQRRVAAEITAPAPPVAEHLPVAAIFVVDTSLSMAYQHQGEDRLEAARALIREHLGHLPAGSRVAVIENSGDVPGVFTNDLSAIQDRLGLLTPRPLSRTLNESLETALTLQEEDRRRLLEEQTGVPEDRRQDRLIREIYVVTDLARSAWQPDSTPRLKERLAELNWVGLYLLDVGVERPVNAGLSAVKLSRQSVASGGFLTVEAAVTSAAVVKPELPVELWLTGDDGQPAKMGQQLVTLDPNSETSVQFTVENVTGRFRQGELRISGSDPFVADNTACFTVQVHPPLEVLVVAERREEAAVWMQALAPDELVRLGRSRCRTTFLPTGKLIGTDLAKFQVICLVHAAQPDARVWERLTDYVTAGGGLFLSLGARSAVTGQARPGEGIDPTAWNSSAARQVVPGELKAELPFAPAATLEWSNPQHPLCRKLEELGAMPQFADIEVRRYWSIQPVEDAGVIARYSRPPHVPALVERRVGRGRVLLLTTAVDSAAWNDLQGGAENSWVYVVLADQFARRLAGLGEERFNFLVGDDVELPLNPAQAIEKVVVRMPEFKQRQQEVVEPRDLLLLSGLADPGQYQVEAVEPATNEVQGFSLNLSGAESDFRRLEVSELDRLLGEKRYSVSRDPQTLERSLAVGRLGQEVYGLLLTCLIGFFILEQLTSAWFYEQEAGGKVASAQ